MDIIDRATYIHVTGNKYYEITAIWNEYTDIGILVKKWGSGTLPNMGGGGIKIESVPNAQHRLLLTFDSESKKRVSRGYELISSSCPVDVIKDIKLLDYFNNFDAEKIANALGIPFDEVPVSEIVSEVPQVNINFKERYDSWGSW